MVFYIKILKIITVNYLKIHITFTYKRYSLKLLIDLQFKTLIKNRINNTNLIYFNSVRYLLIYFLWNTYEDDLISISSNKMKAAGLDN